jgi:RHS repeat-associated protein
MRSHGSRAACASSRAKQEVNPTGKTGGTATYYDYNNGDELQCRQTFASSTECSGSSSTELSHYTYDKAGEQLTITPKNDTTGTTFAYNAASELSTLTPSTESALSLTYGGTGQDDLLTKGSSTTIENSLLGITREVVSGNANSFERTPEGLLIDIRTPSGNYNPLYDAQGDIIALVNSSHETKRTFRYGPYGENVKSEGTQTIPFIFGYKGGYRMPGGNKGTSEVANGLYHYGQRYYDPTTGRWTQQDPVGLAKAESPRTDLLEHRTNAEVAPPVEEMGTDRFAFVSGDPLDFRDPEGLKKHPYHGKEGALIGAVAGGTAGTVAGTAACGPACGFVGGLAGGAAGSVVGEFIGEGEEL